MTGVFIFSKLFRFIRRRTVKLADTLLHPLKDMPVPDFNSDEETLL